MENVRFNISPCMQNEVAQFIGKIDRAEFVPNGEVKANDKSHYDRYSFLSGGSRVALVYDTSANILSITGREDHAQTLLDLFGPSLKTVKRSTVPAQGSVPTAKTPKRPPIAVRTRPVQPINTVIETSENGTRAKLFVSPDSIKRKREYVSPTVFVSSRGAVISTDEIYPPQTVKRKPRPTDDMMDGDVIYPPQVVKKRPLPSYGESGLINGNVSESVSKPRQDDNKFVYAPPRPEIKNEYGLDNAKPVGIAISVAGRTTPGVPRKAVISFGTEEDGKTAQADIRVNTRSTFSEQQSSEPQPEKRKRGRPPKVKPQPDPAESLAPQPEKRKRGRPPKILKAQNDLVAQPLTQQSPEYKNGYCVKNFPAEALTGAIKRLRSYGKTVGTENTEFAGTPQEIKNYTVSDSAGQRVLLRYATHRKTLQLQGKRSDLFGEVMSQVSYDSDYSSALENYVNKSNTDADKKVSDIQNKLKKRLPTAFGYLSEQSRIDFSYGIHDFSQQGLQLSDYSVLLVPAFRGLERFVFDLQTAEGIKVKMIGQAFDKDDTGRYILKTGYTQRINSVVYAEVLVALYTEYFSQRNFFAHSDNTGSNLSRSIPERAAALSIFNHLLDVVEYNAKKLKEIGFKM